MNTVCATLHIWRRWWFLAESVCLWWNSLDVLERAINFESIVRISLVLCVRETVLTCFLPLTPSTYFSSICRCTEPRPIYLQEPPTGQRGRPEFLPSDPTPLLPPPGQPTWLKVRWRTSREEYSVQPKAVQAARVSTRLPPALSVQAVRLFHLMDLCSHARWQGKPTPPWVSPCLFWINQRPRVPPPNLHSPSRNCCPCEAWKRESLEHLVRKSWLWWGRKCEAYGHRLHNHILCAMSFQRKKLTDICLWSQTP